MPTAMEFQMEWTTVLQSLMQIKRTQMETVLAMLASNPKPLRQR
jgi:hypothetical protein